MPEGDVRKEIQRIAEVIVKERLMILEFQTSAPGDL
jgi:hypothetical protein